MRILSFLLVALSTCIVSCSPDEKHDEDSILIKTFRDQRSSFDALLGMIQADRDLERVDYDWTYPNPSPVSPERLSEYRRLLKRVGCARGFEHFKGKEGITLVASASGMVTGGASKGYYFSKVAPTPMVEDLDSYRPKHIQSYQVYRHIEGDWYLVYECGG